MDQGKIKPNDKERETDAPQMPSTTMKTTDSPKLSEQLPSMHEIAPICVLSVVNVSTYVLITIVVPDKQQTMVLCLSALSMISVIIVHSQQGDRITNLLQNWVKILVLDGVVGAISTFFGAIKFMVCRLYDDFRLESVLTHALLVLAIIVLRNWMHSE